MTIGESENIYELPDYLGFGILNQDSIVRTEKCVSAIYALGLEPVYAVEWTHDGCKLEEFYQGDTIGSAYGEKLSLAFFRLLTDSNPLTHPRFFQLGKSIIESGNIHFIYPNMKSGCLYYPAGFIFSLIQPIVDCNYDAWAGFASSTERNDAEFVSQIDARPGAIYRLMTDGTTSKYNTTLIHLASKLLDLIKSVELCQQNGLIPSEKEYRMTITTAGSGLDSLNLYSGDLKRGIKEYAVFEFGTELGQILEDNADQSFATLCSVPHR